MDQYLLLLSTYVHKCTYVLYNLYVRLGLKANVNIPQLNLHKKDQLILFSSPSMEKKIEDISHLIGKRIIIRKFKEVPPRINWNIDNKETQENLVSPFCKLMTTF